MSRHWTDYAPPWLVLTVTLAALCDVSFFRWLGFGVRGWAAALWPLTAVVWAFHTVRAQEKVRELQKMVNVQFLRRYEAQIGKQTWQ